LRNHYQNKQRSTKRTTGQAGVLSGVEQQDIEQKENMKPITITNAYYIKLGKNGL
jgi:hypothetical protein